MTEVDLDQLGAIPNRPGLYVIQFPERVKIGRARAMRTRLRAHLRDGAQRAFVEWTERGYLETSALRIARARWTRVGGSESFTDLPVRMAVLIVEAVTIDG